METVYEEVRKHVCPSCGAEHDTEFEAVQCGCGYDWT